MRHLMGVALLAAITPCVWAQSFLGPQRALAPPNFSHSHTFHRERAYYPVAFFDPLYADYSSASPPPPPEPQVIFLQAAPVPPSEAPAPTAQPLLIELQDNRYVQLSGGNDSRAQMISPGQGSIARSISAARTSAAAVRNVVLVFRDGHTEDISAYTIADGVLYASGDYIATGSWNRKIDLASLNLPETVKQNKAQGIFFRLPSSANEVMVWP